MAPGFRFPLLRLPLPPNLGFGAHILNAQVNPDPESRVFDMKASGTRADPRARFFKGTPLFASLCRKYCSLKIASEQQTIKHCAYPVGVESNKAYKLLLGWCVFADVMHDAF